MVFLVCLHVNTKIKKCFYYIFMFIEICLYLASIATLIIFPKGIIFDEYTQKYIICNIVFAPIFIIFYHIG